MQFRQLDIGGIRINAYENQAQVIEHMFAVQTQEGSCTAIAINPEKVMAARSNPSLRASIENSSIRYADGVGITKYAAIKAGVKIARVPGCDLWEGLMAYAGKQGVPVFLVGASPEVHALTLEKLKAKYHTHVVGSSDGYFSDEAALIHEIVSSGAKVVTVAMGSPKQEIFIQKCIDAGAKAVFMGVGGTYDVFTGKVKRAPRVWRKLGVEWLYRLLSQPTRWRRQLNLVRFVVLSVFNRL